MDRTKIYLGDGTGIRRRLENISGNPSSLHPPAITNQDIIPVWDMSQDYEERIYFNYNPIVPATVAGGTFNIGNNQEFLERLNGARAVRFEAMSWKLTCTSGAVPNWGVLVHPYVQVRIEGMQVNYELAAQYWNIAPGDQFTEFKNPNLIIELDAPLFNNQGGSTTETPLIEIFSLAVDIDNLDGGTGTFDSFTSVISLLY